MAFKPGDRVSITGVITKEDDSNSYWIQVDKPERRSINTVALLHISQFELWIPPEPMAEVEFVIDNVGDIWGTTSTHLWVRVGDDLEDQTAEAHIWSHLWRKYGPLRGFSEVKL